MREENTDLISEKQSDFVSSTAMRKKKFPVHLGLPIVDFGFRY
jgi:hypothetical protein